MKENSLSDQSYKDIYIYVSFIVISFLFLASHSLNTSPFYIGYGGDSANYLVMGKMLLAGKVPYIEFFDHKGPMMIFIEALGQWLIPDRMGLFIMQIINLTLILFITFNTGRLFLNKINSFTISMLTLLFLAFTIEGGNLTEEYSLLFTTLALYITLKFQLSTDKLNLSPNNKVVPLHMVLLGICGAVLLWIRLNNMGVVCACTIFIFIVSIKNKDWKGVRDLILYFIVGMLIVTLPLLFYFFLNYALWDMIFAAFIYNFKYVGINESPSPFDSIVTTFFYILKAWMPFVVLLIGALAYYLKKEKDYKVILLSTLLFIFGYVTTHIGAAYYHYMTLNIPCLILGLLYLFAVVFNNSDKKLISKILLVIISIILAAYTGYRFQSHGALGNGDKSYIDQSKDIISHIPENERNSIYAYQTMTRFHASSGTFPYYKYFMMQEWQGKYNPQLLADINDMLENNSPKWVITQFRDQSTNHRFWEIIDQKYELHYKNYLFELYKLKR
jgi:hypothetical protein